MALTDADIATVLAAAGLRLIERVRESVQLPLPTGLGPASCGPEHGRFDLLPHEFVDVDDPDLSARVNAGWWRMATEFGLLDEQREFLLAVNDGGPGGVHRTHPAAAWVRVRLLDEWDIAGSGVFANSESWFARLVGEFTAVSLDGRMLMNTTVWGNGKVSTIVIRPDRLPIGGPSTGHKSV